MEALLSKPKDCLVGLDLNYRSTLWPEDQAKKIMTPIIDEHVNVLITTIEDIARIFNIGCGKYSARQIVNGDMARLEDEDLIRFSHKVMDLFNIDIIAITIRYPDSFETHRWESAAMNRNDYFFRSPSVHSIVLKDRLGGGDTWNAGFYYGLFSENFTEGGIQKGIIIGDAFTRIKQTLMFDLPIVEKSEIQELIKEDLIGSGKRTAR